MSRAGVVLLLATCLASPAFAQPEPPVLQDGGDRSAFPAKLKGGAWLPIASALLGGRLDVRITVNGRPTIATLDTGADHTSTDTRTAVELGLLHARSPGEVLKIKDANDQITEAIRVPLGVLGVGHHKWADVTVDAIDTEQRFFLVGMDILESVDLLIVAHEGLVGVFDAGKGPRPREGRTVRFERNRNQLLVRGEAPGRRGAVPFGFILDTGASGTSVPVKIGIDGGLPAHVGLSAVWSGVASRQERRGAFVLDPLRIGSERVDAGRVLASGAVLGRGEGKGLLGMDVFSRHVTLVSPSRELLVLGPRRPRPATRTRGPAGATCKDGPCLQVAMNERERKLVVDVTVDPAYHGRVVEMAIVFEDAGGRPLLNGSAINFYVTSSKRGYRGAASVDNLRELGLERGTRARLAWVRVSGVTWPCDALATHCILWPAWMGAVGK